MRMGFSISCIDQSRRKTELYLKNQVKSVKNCINRRKLTIGIAWRDHIMSYNAVLFKIYCLFFILYKKIGLYIIYTCRNLCNTWSIRPKDKLNLYVYSKSWLHERKVIKDVIPKARSLSSHVPTDTRFHTYCVLLLQVSYACKTPNRNIRTDCLPQLPLRTSVPQSSQMHRLNSMSTATHSVTHVNLLVYIRTWGQYTTTLKKLE